MKMNKEETRIEETRRRGIDHEGGEMRKGKRIMKEGIRRRKKMDNEEMNEREKEGVQKKEDMIRDKK